MAQDGLETIFRECSLCEAHCGIQLTVDRTANRVTDLRGDALDPLSRGYICPKAIGMKGISEDPDRLRAPMRRVGGSFEEISWDEALDLVAERLLAIREEHGANSIATYLGNPSAHDFAANLSLPHLIRSIGSKWRFSATSVDQLPRMVANQLLYGAPGSFPVADIDHTDFFLVLGGNPVVSNGSIMTAPDMRGRLRALRERGGRLVVVDPRRSETAALADEHLAIRPGTDALLLAALLQVLFAEERTRTGEHAALLANQGELAELVDAFTPEAVAPATGLEAEAIRRLADDFAAAPRAACYGRIGICTQEFGTLASWLVDALNILSGNFDRPGGILFPQPAHAPAGPPRRREGMPYARWRSRVRGLPEFAGELPVAALAEEIDMPGEGQVRALVTVAGNPVCSTPNAARLDRALASLDFMVSLDIYLNETTRHADVILPTTAPLERANYPLVFHNLSVRNFAKWSPPALEPPPGVRPFFDIACELTGRMSGADGATVQAMLRAGMVARVAGPKSDSPDVSPAEAEAALEENETTPEFLLDAMIRGGKRGDRFHGAGLSLARVREAEHGLDLGPLTAGVADVLATVDGRIDLAPELIREDFGRLQERVSREDSGLVLIGRRHLRSNNSWMHNIEALAKGDDRCTLLVHPDDADAHGLAEGASVRISSRVGTVMAPVEITTEMRRGVVSLPHGYGHESDAVRLGVARALQAGVNSNELTDEAGIDPVSGNAILNGIPVTLAHAN